MIVPQTQDVISSADVSGDGLDNPKKWWKYQPGDLDDHAR